jgi:hypothetical protein
MVLVYLFEKIFFYIFFIYICNHAFYFLLAYYESGLEDENIIEKIEIKEDIKNEKKYEDKFLEDIRKLNKEYIFDEIEKKILEEKEIGDLNNYINSYKNKKKEIEININHIELKINELKIKENNNLEKNIEQEEEEEQEQKDEEEEDEGEEEEDEGEEEEDEGEEEEEKDNIDDLFNEKNKLENELNKLNYFLEDDNGINELVNKSKQNAINFIINKRIEKLKNCYVMESTPQGNVIMIYDNNCSSFKYYSDNAIPYRYLEVVSRKYVKFFDCRPLYVDMEEELKIAEEKWENERIKKEQEELKIKEENILKKVEKKNVFTKFKSYNKEGITGRVNKGVPPKNSIPITKQQENDKILLKENANRYTYEGKMANFSFLKKIDRKVVDKKYGLTFADFKKIQSI